MYNIMLMNYTIYMNNVCLNLQNVSCGRVYIPLGRVHRSIEATVYSDYLRGGETVDITH